MARTRNDTWGVAQSVDVTARDAAEQRSIQAQSEHLYADPFARVSSGRSWRPWLVIAAIRQAYGRAVAGRASAASSAGASPIGTNRVAHEVVQRILHRRWLHQCPATLRICRCRGIAVVVVLVTAISWTALGGGMVPAAADQPIDDTTAAPAPGPAPALPGHAPAHPGHPPAQGPGLPAGAGTADGPLTEPPVRTPFIIPRTITPTTPPITTAATPPITTAATPPITTAATPPITTAATPPITTAATPPITTRSTPPTTTAATPPITTAATPPITTAATPPITTAATPPITTAATPPITTAATPPITAPTTPTVTPPVPPTGHDPTGGGALALLLAVVFALLLSAGLFTRAHRHRGVSWMKAHVTVAPRPGPGATFETRPGDDPNRDHVLCVVPVEIQRSTTVEKNPL